MRGIAPDLYGKYGYGTILNNPLGKPILEPCSGNEYGGAQFGCPQYSSSEASQLAATAQSKYDNSDPNGTAGQSVLWAVVGVSVVGAFAYSYFSK